MPVIETMKLTHETADDAVQISGATMVAPEDALDAAEVAVEPPAATIEAPETTQETSEVANEVSDATVDAIVAPDTTAEATKDASYASQDASNTQSGAQQTDDDAVETSHAKLCNWRVQLPAPYDLQYNEDVLKTASAISIPESDEVEIPVVLSTSVDDAHSEPASDSPLSWSSEEVASVVSGSEDLLHESTVP